MENFFKPKTSKERKEEQDSKKHENVLKCKQSYEEKHRGRKFLEKWRTDFEWVEYSSLETLYGEDNKLKILDILVSLRDERKKEKTKENESFDNVMYCKCCREKYFN